MELDNFHLVLLGLVGLAAGTIDTIAGGGGLLTLPALMACGLPAPVAMGTNKGQSVFGSGTALLRFAGSHLFDGWRAVVSFVPALAGAAMGAGGLMMLALRRPAVLNPLVMVMLTGVAVFMVVYRGGKRNAEGEMRNAEGAGAVGGPGGLAGTLSPNREAGSVATEAVVLAEATGTGVPGARLWAAVLIAFLIAAYDGFFGPGTGTFLILAYAVVFRDPLDAASANAKLVNFCSNLASVVLFAWQGWILWQVALPMALGQMTGALIGAHITLRKGKGVVRVVAVVVCLALVGKVGWDFWRG